MKIECPNCQTKLKMDDAKIPEKGVKAKCPKCGERIHLMRSAPAVEPVAPPEEKVRVPEPPPVMPPPLPPDHLDAPSHQPGPDPKSVQDVPDRLIVSILVTILLCMPMGVAAIIFSVRARTQKAAGNYEQARSSARVAGILCAVSLGITILVVVLGIIAAIAIPQFMAARQKAMDESVRSALNNLKTAQEAYYLDHDTYSARLEDLIELYQPIPEIQMEILAGDWDSWSGWASHTASPNRFIYSSAEGGLRGPDEMPDD